MRQHESPSHEYRPVVESLWVAARDLSAEGGFVVTPDQFVDLLFFDADVALENAGFRETLPRIVLLGPLTRSVRLISAGVAWTAGLRMPIWVSGLLPVKAQTHELWCDARPLTGPAGDAILAALGEHGFPQVFRELRNLLNKLFRPSPDNLRRETAAALARGNAAASANELSGRLGISRRQAERRFKDCTQLSPKQFASIVRFQMVRDRLWSCPEISLAQLACDAGYADQAHMTREFRRYTGITPRDFAIRCQKRP